MIMTDKPCIILVRDFDSTVGYVHARFRLMYFIISTTAAKESRNFVICGILCSQLSHTQFFDIVLPDDLVYLHCVVRHLDQFDGLKSYYISCSEAETSKVVSVL